MAIVPDRPNRSETFEQDARPRDEWGRMNAAPILGWHVVGAIFAALSGIAFFFVIIGVFGLSASIAALVLFAALAVLIFRRPQAEETRP
jgi:hypothetical protein